MQTLTQDALTHRHAMNFHTMLRTSACVNNMPVKVLVGLMGSVEIPFVVRLIGKEWRVEPQPYFALINQ